MHAPTFAHVLMLAGGALLVLLILSDTIGTLVVTGGQTRLWRPARLWYATTWRMTRTVAIHLPARASEFALQVYPATSLLGLLVLWLVGLVIGWALIYAGLGERIAGAGDWGTILYYAGTSLLTPSFGVVRDPLVRFLSLVEALTGLGTIALLISYLPALYGAYSRREARLLTLDDPGGGRLTPVRIVAVHAPDGDLDRLDDFFAEWEMWSAEVLESHVSYPMLALFRSQHTGQSWITALGVVTDAATLCCACVLGADHGGAYFAHRRGRRAVLEIAARLHVHSHDSAPLSRPQFDVAWSILAGTGLPLRDQDDAWQRLLALRADYHEPLQQLIDYLLAPHGFWGDSAEATAAAEVKAAMAEARARARRTTQSRR